MVPEILVDSSGAGLAEANMGSKSSEVVLY